MVTDAPEAPVDVVQLEPEAPASPPVDGAPAEPPEAAPDQPAETPSFAWDDPDTAETIFELGGEALLKTERGQAEVERRAQELAEQQVAELRGTPDHNVQFQQFRAERDGAHNVSVQKVNELVPLLQTLEQGGEADPKVVARITGEAIQAAQHEARYAAAVVNQEHRVAAEATMLELYGGKGDLVVGKAQSGKPLTLDQAFDNALRAYDSDVQRGDASAGVTLNKRVMHMIQAAARLEGHQGGQTAAQKKLDATEKAKSDAKINELAAQVAAKRNGQTAPTVAGTAPPNLDPAKLNQRMAYGVDSDGNKATEADRAAFRQRYPQ